MSSFRKIPGMKHLTYVLVAIPHLVGTNRRPCHARGQQCILPVTWHTRSSSSSIGRPLPEKLASFVYGFYDDS